MKLFYSANSPYARIARIAAFECGVDFEPVLLESQQLRHPDNPVLAYNCTGRIPTIVDGDTVVTESRACSRYLESVGNGNQLFAYAGDWQAEQMENTAMSFLDGCALWTREYRRPEEKQFDWLVDVERDRAERSLAWFNAQPAIQNNETPWDFAHITLAVGIEYQDFRSLSPDWQDRHGAVADWLAAQLERPGMKAHPMVQGA